MKAFVNESDVRNVADQINVAVTDEQISKVLEMYDDESDNDPTATWDLIVENCIYTIVKHSEHKHENRMTQDELITNLVDFEMGCLGSRDTLILFAELVKTGRAWTLQGSYGRMAEALIKDGVVTPQGQVDWSKYVEDTEDLL